MMISAMKQTVERTIPRDKMIRVSRNVPVQVAQVAFLEGHFRTQGYSHKPVIQPTDRGAVQDDKITGLETL